jgi:hypothetical protein
MVFGLPSQELVSSSLTVKVTTLWNIFPWIRLSNTDVARGQVIGVVQL